MVITSTAFQHGESIPEKYTCDGQNVSPPLTFSEIPEQAQSLALIMEDPDAPNGTFTHWVIYDMPPAILQIVEASEPEIGTNGRTDFDRPGYGGPCPPNGEHRYFFKLFALDTMLNLEKGKTAQEVYEAMDGHIIETTELIGAYKRQGGSHE